MKYPVKSVGIKHLDWISLILETELPSYSKMLAMYLSRFMNKDQNVAWPSLRRIESELSITRATACKYLDVLESEGWILRERSESRKNTRYIISYPKQIEKVVHDVNHVVHQMNHGGSPDKPQVVHHTDTNQQSNQPLNQPIKKEGRFTPPSLQEVNKYIFETGLKMDGESFVDHFTSNGWKVSGRAPMKCWKSACRNWAKRQAKFNPKTDKPIGATRYERIRRELARAGDQDTGNDSRALSALQYHKET